MKPLFRVLKSLLLWVNVISAALLLAGNCSHLIDPALFWQISVTTLIFPVIFIACASFLLLWLLIERKYMIISGIAIILSMPSVLKYFSFHLPTTFNKQKSSQLLRIATWNAGLMNIDAGDTNKIKTGNREIFKALK